MCVCVRVCCLIRFKWHRVIEAFDPNTNFTCTIEANILAVFSNWSLYLFVWRHTHRLSSCVFAPNETRLAFRSAATNNIRSQHHSHSMHVILLDVCWKCTTNTTVCITLDLCECVCLCVCELTWEGIEIQHTLPWHWSYIALSSHSRSSHVIVFVRPHSLNVCN